MGWLLQREWVAPLLVLGLSFLLLLRFDQQQRGEVEASRERAAMEARESAARLADAIGNAVSTRIGAPPNFRAMPPSFHHAQYAR